MNVCRVTPFESLQTVNGTVCSTFRGACKEFSLLQNKTPGDTTIARQLLVHLQVRYVDYLLK